MNRRYTFKLYPNKAQTVALEQQAQMRASLWNALLEMRENFYRRARQRGDKKTSLTAFDQGKDITELRAAMPEWAALPRGPLIMRISFSFHRPPRRWFPIAWVYAKVPLCRPSSASMDCAS